MILHRVLKFGAAIGMILYIAGAVADGTPAVHAAEPDLTGTWEGMSQAYCGAQTARTRCNAVQKITLNLRQHGKSIGGEYGCAYGNMVCRNLNTTGKIVSGDYLGGGNVMMRILMPDATTCRFSGKFNAASANGNYKCYTGNRTIESGMWRVTRGM